SSRGPTPTCIATGWGSIPRRRPCCATSCTGCSRMEGDRLSTPPDPALALLRIAAFPIESLEPLAAPAALARLAPALELEECPAPEGGGVNDALYPHAA